MCKFMNSTITVTNILDCFGCQPGKQHALPSNKRSSVTYAPFELIHFDIWEPSSQSIKGGSLYYVLFIDDFTHFT